MNKIILDLVITEIKKKVEQIIELSKIPDRPGYVAIHEDFLRQLTEIATRE